jgi:hypothetical protein
MLNAQNSQGAFWSPELSLGGRAYRRGYLILRPESLGSRAYAYHLWFGLRWRFLAVTERVLLLAAVVAVALPRPASGSLSLAIKSGGSAPSGGASWAWRPAFLVVLLIKSILPDRSSTFKRRLIADMDGAFPAGAQRIGGP